MQQSCFPLHPEWWERLKAGEKLLEIRKTRPRGNDPYTVLVYVTGGVGVVGEFVCDCFYKLDTMPEITPWDCRSRTAESLCGAGT